MPSYLTPQTRSQTRSFQEFIAPSETPQAGDSQFPPRKRQGLLRSQSKVTPTTYDMPFGEVSNTTLSSPRRLNLVGPRNSIAHSFTVRYAEDGTLSRSRLSRHNSSDNPKGFNILYSPSLPIEYLSGGSSSSEITLYPIYHMSLTTPQTTAVDVEFDTDDLNMATAFTRISKVSTLSCCDINLDGAFPAISIPSKYARIFAEAQWPTYVQVHPSLVEGASPHRAIAVELGPSARICEIVTGNDSVVGKRWLRYLSA